MSKFNPGNTDSSAPIIGLPNGDDGHPLLRQELRAFAKDKDLFNLYLLGLWTLQQVPKEQDLSWYQICGIHGMPWERWPQKDDRVGKPATPESGFCTHSSILFLTWHRPYLALFETTLHQAMRWVAEQATEEEGRSRYVKVLQNFRIPYWDWALPATKETPVFPAEAADSDKVKLPMPAKMKRAYGLTSQNALVEVYNPLFCAPFPEGTEDDLLIEKRMTTQRYFEIPEPTPEQRLKNLLDHAQPYSQEWRETFGETPPERNLRERVVYLLQSYNDFAEVSHNMWNKVPLPKKQIIRPEQPPITRGMGFGSFEDIHNSMHMISGGPGRFKGHMRNPAISAFDPIFWLHHANIDRLFTIWQALHNDPADPNTYVTPRPATGTWVTAPGQTENENTLLVPFYGKEGKFWDSAGVRSADTFGYAYPETQHWKFATKQEFRDDIALQLNALYPNSSLGKTIKALKAGNKDAAALEQSIRKRAATLATIIHTKSIPNDTATLLNVALQREAATSSALAQPSQKILAALPDYAPVPIYEVPSDLTLTSLADNNTYLEWLVSIKAEKHTMDGQYSVHIFLDNVDETKTHLFTMAPNHVGTFYPFGQSADTGCAKCQVDQASRVEISGQIPLTVALAERYFAGLVRSLKPADVVPYLQTNLHWRVIDENGQLVQDQSLVSGLLVGVISNEVTLPDDGDGLPSYSPDITHYPEVTTNRIGAGRGHGTGMTDNELFFAISGTT